MKNGNQSEFAEMREEIVAYLDGELPPDQSAAVERRLASDDGYRHEMLQLQRTWDILDQLPRTTASSDFTRSTMEMAAHKASRAETQSWLKKLNWKWIAICVLAAAAGFGGYAWAAKKAAEPNEDLARDLQLYQEYEMFEGIDSIEFVQRLDEEALFSGEALSVQNSTKGVTDAAP